MAKTIDPTFPKGLTYINSLLSFETQDDVVQYFSGFLPIFQHKTSDIRTFRLILSQFYINGNATQAQMERVFGIPSITIKRAVALYREKGPDGFFAEPNRRGASVLTPEIIVHVQSLLDKGMNWKDIANQEKIKPDTLRKAIQKGKFKKKSEVLESETSTKSQRSFQDSKAVMGVGATNTLDRIAASLGKLEEMKPIFNNALDIPNGGVLLALPALLLNNLLTYTREQFKLPRGYYGVQSVFMLLAFMALARLKFLESLRYVAPGEWGKLLGLDRVPEVRTVRKKVELLVEENQPTKWSAKLCQEWMKASPSEASYLYVDGHVRVYHGYQTKLPRHYVSRDKLCARAVCDYWVNAAGGKPFFVVTKEIDPGLISVLETEIIPRLERDVPQPSKDELEADPFLPRFTIFCDREGYSPKAIKAAWDKRIAIQTYHKYQKENWPVEEFKNYDVKLPNGEVVKTMLAERGSLLGGIVWVREIRKLKSNNTQGSIVSTNFKTDIVTASVGMFSRWSQENFFSYMRAHYSLDRLVDYDTEEIPGTTKVVNPEYRKLESQIRKNNSLLNRKRLKFISLEANNDIEKKNMEKYLKAKSELHEEIQGLESAVVDLKVKKKEQQKHIIFAELPEEHKFERLRIESKHFIDTIKMIAYRAETNMVGILRDIIPDHDQDEARVLMRAIYNSSIDMEVDEKNKILRIKLHRLASPGHDAAATSLCEELTAAEILYPDTDLRLVYEMISG
jgi:hypothetical protein